jgi:signal transduction histidine kinase
MLVFARGLAMVALLTALTIVLATLLLDPPAKDLVLLAIFLPISGCVSLVVGLGFASLYRGTLLRGIRGKLLVAVLLSAGLVMVNVGFTGYLMFLSSHDLTLMALLMLFSLGMSTFFALVVADAFQSTLGLLMTGVQRMGGGDLQTRVTVASGDELQDLAGAFNSMAARLEEASNARRDMEEARRHLIGAVSHDLRTPLATMRAMIESINDGVVRDQQTIDRYHRTIQGEITYLSRLIDDLFELSQIDSGLLQLRPEPSSVGDLVSDALEALKPQAEQRRLTLCGEVPSQLPSVIMDVPRMQRVLYNLVQNALRHTPADGSVVIRAVDDGDQVQVWVEDTGEGVEAEELPLLFERFYRGSKARSREEAGSGLGLTIAKGIVELHGGRIWAESKQGAGSSFVFTVPHRAAAS